VRNNLSQLERSRGWSQPNLLVKLFQEKMPKKTNLSDQVMTITNKCMKKI
jgi:hypothetical protein